MVILGNTTKQRYKGSKVQGEFIRKLRDNFSNDENFNLFVLNLFNSAFSHLPSCIMLFTRLNCASDIDDLFVKTLLLYNAADLSCRSKMKRVFEYFNIPR